MSNNCFRTVTREEFEDLVLREDFSTDISRRSDGSYSDFYIRVSWAMHEAGEWSTLVSCSCDDPRRIKEPKKSSEWKHPQDYFRDASRECEPKKTTDSDSRSGFHASSEGMINLTHKGLSFFGVQWKWKARSGLERKL